MELVGKAGDRVTQWVVMTDHAAMSDGLGEFLARSIPGEWTESRRGAHLECAFHSDGEAPENVAWPLARALAQYLVVYHERDWLDELLRHRYHTFDPGEQRQILDDVVHMLHADRDQDQGRLDLATTLIFNYLKTAPELVIEGIRTFLMGDIRTEYEEAIDQAVDIYLMEQEYQEFVRLLRQLVDVAGTQHDWIHVRYTADRFHFEDPAGHRLADSLIDDMLEGVDRQLGGLDDVLISALVTLAPSRITIHRGEIGREGRETLVQVFDGRVLFCHGCARCYTTQVDSDWRTF